MSTQGELIESSQDELSNSDQEQDPEVTLNPCRLPQVLSGTWSRDFSMDKYVSWGLPTDQLTLEIIWERFEDFCKPQSNEVWARFDLLTSFRQGNKSVDEWYNTVQAQVNLAKYPPETTKILHRDIFWFFLRDEEFVSRTISDGSVNLEKFLASKV